MTSEEVRRLNTYEQYLKEGYSSEYASKLAGYSESFDDLRKKNDVFRFLHEKYKQIRQTERMRYRRKSW